MGLLPVDVLLRDVTRGDLVIFFQQQMDPVANRMVGFTAEDPTDAAAFAAMWAKILADPTGTAKTIVVADMWQATSRVSSLRGLNCNTGEIPMEASTSMYCGRSRAIP